MYKLYDILLSDFIGEEVKKHLFYRGDNFIYKNEDNSYYLKRNYRTGYKRKIRA